MSHSAFALLNLALIFGAAFIGMRMYWRAHPDSSAGKGSRMISARVRAWYFSNLQPFEDLLVRRGVPPVALTYLQVVLSVASAFAYGMGLIYSAGFLVLCTGTLDILDGKVARRTNAESPRGAFLDSVMDRYAEFVSFVGIIVFFGSGWAVWAALLAILGGMMVSYARARAESLGLRCDIGLLQRPERFVLLGFGSIFSSVWVHACGGGHGLLVATVVLLAVLANLTAAQRIVYASRRLARAGA